MDYSPRYKTFNFGGYEFNHESLTLNMHYDFDDQRHFTETLEYGGSAGNYNKEVLDRVCQYVYLVAGTSYYKTFPGSAVDTGDLVISPELADLLNDLYVGGMSQYLYENSLPTSIMPSFKANGQSTAIQYEGDGILLMQSGGKDSLLAAELLLERGHRFTMHHTSTTGLYPKFLDQTGMPMVVTKRTIDRQALKQSELDGGFSGHIPFSAIFGGISLIQAVLLNLNLVVSAIETSSEEPNLVRDDGLEVNHQYSKRYHIERATQAMLHNSISPNLNYGSILRPFNEVRIGELFAKYAWGKYRHNFSSCNLANYKQGEDDGSLTWDGTCPKCANSFLILAPFVPKDELLEIFDGKNLLQADDMQETYRQLLDLSDIKPMECVGTFAEMQHAYHLAVAKDADYGLPFEVSKPDFDTTTLEPHQALFGSLMDYTRY